MGALGSVGVGLRLCRRHFLSFAAPGLVGTIIYKDYTLTQREKAEKLKAAEQA